MSDPGESQKAAADSSSSKNLDAEIGRKAARRVKAGQERRRSVWFGLGMFGLVGWSVAVPTLLGAVVGAWLDRQIPGQTSWTLTLLIAGVVIGCLNAWRWISDEGEVP